MLLFPNATLTMSRLVTSGTSAGALQAIANNLAARIEPNTFGLQLTQAGRSIEVAYLVTLDWDPANPLDVRLGDELTGWNPRGVKPAPKLHVGRVNLNDAWPPYSLELWVTDPRTTE